MKARPVEGLDPQAPLADAAERIVRVRLDELVALAPRALRPKQVKALHDMRIAAKRLRYLLEVTGFCFGPGAKEAGAEAKGLQDLLGEIHDCDVTLERVGKLRKELQLEAGEQMRGRRALRDLGPKAIARDPRSNAWAGLEGLAVHLRARRALLFERFAALWAQLEAGGFTSRLQASLAERAEATLTE